MSDLVKDLTDRAERLESDAAEHHEFARSARGSAEDYDRKADRAEAQARQLRNVVALLTGDVEPLAPGDITAAEDDLGLSVGLLRIAPPADASTADLRLYLGTVRRMYELAMHQSRLAGDEIRRREGREGQAALVTGELPVLAIAEQLAAPPAEPPDPLEPLPPNAVDSREQVAAALATTAFTDARTLQPLAVQSVTVREGDGQSTTAAEAPPAPEPLPLPRRQSVTDAVPLAIDPRAVHLAPAALDGLRNLAGQEPTP